MTTIKEISNSANGIAQYNKTKELVEQFENGTLNSAFYEIVCVKHNATGKPFQTVKFVNGGFKNFPAAI